MIKQSSLPINRCGNTHVRYRSRSSPGCVKALDPWNCSHGSRWTDSIQLHVLKWKSPLLLWNAHKILFLTPSLLHFFCLLCLVNKMLVILCASPACGVLSDTFANIMTSLILDSIITISWVRSMRHASWAGCVLLCSQEKSKKFKLKSFALKINLSNL